MKEAEQERSPAVESAAGETKSAVKRSVAFRAEIAHNGSFVPRPGPFDRIEFGGVGWQPDEREPMRLLFDELAGSDASVRGDAIPDYDDGSGQVLVKLLEELDDVFGTNGPWNQAEEEAGSATVRGVGRSSNRRQMLPVAEAMFEDRGLPPRRPRTLDRGPLRESTLVDEDDRRA